jgi:hypothetical protein
MLVWRFEKPINAVEWNYQGVRTAVVPQQTVFHGGNWGYQLYVGQFLGNQNDAGITLALRKKRTFELLLGIWLPTPFALGVSLVRVVSGWSAQATNSVRVLQIGDQPSCGGKDCQRED